MLALGLFALSGILLGGAFSLRNQGAPRAAVVITLLLALLALAGGIAWLLPGDR